MKMRTVVCSAAAIFAAMTASAFAADDTVVIGDIDDMSGVYADVIGQSGVEAANMAIADFGGSVLGKTIDVPVLRPPEQARYRRREVPRMGRPATA